MTFVGQNLGAGKMGARETGCYNLCQPCDLCRHHGGHCRAALGTGNDWPFNSNPDVIAYGVERLLWVTAPYFVFGIADVLVGEYPRLRFPLLPWS